MSYNEHHKWMHAPTMLLFSCLAIYGAATSNQATPVTISPAYSNNVGVTGATPANIADVRSLLASALAPAQIDGTAYYVIHRLVYNLDSNGLTDAGWYIYYEPWQKRHLLSLAWLDDPLSKGNYLRKRLYGTNEIHLVPVVLWPAFDLGKADARVYTAFEQQVVREILTTGGLKEHDMLLDPQKIAKGGADADAERADATKRLAANLEGLFSLHVSDTSSYPAALESAETALDADLAARKLLPAGGLQKEAAGLKISPAAGHSAVEIQFTRQLATWIVRRTVAAYAEGNSGDAPPDAEIRLAGSDGKEAALASNTVKNRRLWAVQKFFDQLPSLKGPDYQVTVIARVPQPLQDLKDVLSLAGLAQGGEIVLRIDATDPAFQTLLTFASTAHSRIPINTLPSDVTLAAVNPQSATQNHNPADPGNAAPAPKVGPPQPKQEGGDPGGGHGGPYVDDEGGEPEAGDAAPADPSGGGAQSNIISQIQLQNEKKYRYGLAMGIPLKSFDTVQYDSTNGIVTSKTATKQNVFAFAQFHLMPTDISGVKLRLIPSILVGVPISGKPLDQQIYGGSIGLWKVELFLGTLLHRDLVPASGAAANTVSDPAKTAGSLNPRWGTHLTYGVVIPVSVVKSLLKGNSNNSTANSPAGTPAAGSGSKKKGS